MWKGENNSAVSLKGLASVYCTNPSVGQHECGMSLQKLPTHIHPHTHPHPAPSDDSPHLSTGDIRRNLSTSQVCGTSELQFPGAVCEEGHSVSSQENRVITGIRGGGGKGCPRATSAPVTLSEPKRANHVQCYHGRKLRNSTPHPLNSCPEPGSECLSGRVQSSSCRTAPRSAPRAWSFPHIFSCNTCAAAAVQNSRAC